MATIQSANDLISPANVFKSGTTDDLLADVRCRKTGTSDQIGLCNLIRTK